MMAQSVTNYDLMPTVAIGSLHPRTSLLGPPITPGAPPANNANPNPNRAASAARSRGNGAPFSSAAAAAGPGADSSSGAEGPGGFDPASDDPILNPTLRDMYSLRDLVEIIEGTLYPRLTQVVRQLMAHIVGGRCEICASKAFFCEYPTCPTPHAPIYSFQLNTVIQCPNCAQSFHRACFEPATCPKCARMAARKLTAEQRLTAIKKSQSSGPGAATPRGLGTNGGSYIGTGSLAAPLQQAVVPGSYASAGMDIPTASADRGSSARGLGFAATGASSRHAAAGANGHPCQLSVLQHLLAQAQEPCQLVKPTLECTRQ